MKRLISFMLLTALMLSANATEKKVTLRFIETSDVHGSFFPYDFTNRKPRVGSMARISSYVKQLRKQYGNNVVLLDNGDILQGQPTSYFYNYVATNEPNIAAQVINYLGYDAETVLEEISEDGLPSPYKLFERYLYIYKYFDDWVLIKTNADNTEIAEIIVKKRSKKHVETCKW